jgi:hypothetical protein
MLYERIVENEQVAERIVEGVERNRTVISELGLQGDTRELVEENFRNTENQVRILVGQLIDGMWKQQCLVMDMKQQVQ